jgi:anti-sigma factor RsiW
MTCFENEEWINRYLDGELGPAERRRFEQHLAGCPSCQQELAQTRALFAVLQGLENAPAPAGMADEVLEGLTPRRAPRLSRWILIAQAAATLLMLGLAYPRLAVWYEQLAAWLTPGWLSAELAQAVAWGRGLWATLADELSGLRWSWPRGLGLTWPQAAMMAAALVGLWWLGNRLLLAPGSNGTGGTR